VKSDLFAVFGDQDPHRGAKALEGVLNRLVETEHILLREASTRLVCLIPRQQYCDHVLVLLRRQACKIDPWHDAKNVRTD
jgi:hypothetical protein